MGIETVGLRRLYDALGCHVGAADEVMVTFPTMGGRLGKIYIGPKPPLGIRSIEADLYAIPGKETILMKPGVDHKGECFLEICIAFDIQVEDSISTGLLNKEQDANIEILNKVEPFKADLAKTIDLISGLIGLKFHKQFVLKPLIEDFFILSGPVPVFRFEGPYVESLESITLAAAGADILRSYTSALDADSLTPNADFAKVLKWLLKAWREQDPVAKFMYLFIPLECVIKKNDVPADAQTLQRIEKIQEIISSTGRDDTAELTNFLEYIKNKFAPNINARFERLAQKHRIDGWELDVTAFKKFNVIRNDLLHAGKGPAHAHLDIEDETRTLEDLVERYVSLYVFRDQHVYVNQWRPVRSSTA